MPRPIILMLPPDGLRFLGTFDVADFKQWWYSQPLPGDIEEIISFLQAYGHIYLAICKMKDGSYSIYRSVDQGRNWSQVYNTPLRINALHYVDFGWILASTEDGWIETKTSGEEWHVLSTDAPNCKIVIRLTETIWIAHDGTRIWRTQDGGQTWTIIYTLSQECPAVLAGNYLRVIVGAGDTLLKTDNQGDSLEVLKTWPGWKILNALHTDDREWTPEGNSYLVRVLMPAQGIVRHFFTEDGGQGWLARFDQYFCPSDGPLAYAAVLRPGSEVWDSLVFSAQTSINTAENRQEISLKYSRNDGKDWVDIDASQISLVPPGDD